MCVCVMCEQYERAATVYIHSMFVCDVCVMCVCDVCVAYVTRERHPLCI